MRAVIDSLVLGELRRKVESTTLGDHVEVSVKAGAIRAAVTSIEELRGRVHQLQERAKVDETVLLAAAAAMKKLADG